MIILLPIILFMPTIKNFVYPLKDYTGEFFCYAFHIFEYYAVFVSQYHSFFLNLFRYICLIHDEVLLKNEISVKVSIKIP